MFEFFLTTFMYVDILVICIFLRCFYVGIVKGVIVEIFKFIGIVLATLIALHFYAQASVYLYRMFGIPFVNGELISFSGLAFGVILVFKVARDGWFFVFRIGKNKSKIFSILGFILSVFRAIFISGLLFILLLIPGNKSIDKSVDRSFSGFYFKSFSPDVYGFVYEGFIGKVFSGEKKNKKVFELTSEKKVSKHRRSRKREAR